MLCSIFLPALVPAAFGDGPCATTPPPGAIVDAAGDGAGVVVGTSGDDVIYGLGGDDVIYGLGGDDVICGGDGGDTIFGGSGDDVSPDGDDQIYGEAGDDPILWGEGGADTIDGGAGSDGGDNYVYGGDGPDTVRGGDGTDFLTGGAGADIVEGGGAGDALYGDLGASDAACAADQPSCDDTLSGGDGNDAISGGPGEDDRASYAGAPAAVTVDLAAGTATGGDGGDLLAGVEDVSGSAHGDTLLGDDGNNELIGEGGEDTLAGRGGGDRVSYPDAPSGVTVDLAAGTAVGGDGTDQISGFEQISGSEHGDSLLGDDAENGIFGRGGDDVIDGRGQGDSEGDAALYSGAPSGVTVDLAAGTASGGGGNDQLSGIERLGGSGHDDTLRGDENSNAFFADGGDDVIDGRGKDDGVNFGPACTGVFVNLTGGTALGGCTGSDRLSSIETVSGSDFGDSLVGDDRTNVLRGLGGDDQIWGRGGGDTLSGGPGTDDLFGGPGVLDTADYTGAPSAVDVNLATGQASGGDGTDALAGIEGIYGSPGDDKLIGDEGENYFMGFDGKDQIDGGDIAASPGDIRVLDTVLYFASNGPDGRVDFDTGPVKVNLTKGAGLNQADSSGPDTLSGIEDVIGSTADDVLIGDSRPNSFQGDAGDDHIFGRGGNDSFSGDSGNDELRGGPGRYDFVHYLFDPAVKADLARGVVWVRRGIPGRRVRQPHPWNEKDSVTGMEVLAGSSRSDVLLGSGRPDFLIGGAGRDTIRGRAGNDTLKGGGIFRLRPPSASARRFPDFLLDGGSGHDHCLDRARRRRHCESRSLPAHLQRQLDQLIRALQADIQQHRHRRRSHL